MALQPTYWRIRCITDNKWEYVESVDTPTVCPVNPAHTIGDVFAVVVPTIGNANAIQGDAIEAPVTTPAVGESLVFNGTTYDIDKPAAEHVNYTNTAWDAATTKDAIDKALLYLEETMGTGRVSPVTVLTYNGDLMKIRIAAGAGYISYPGFHKKVSWAITDWNFGPTGLNWGQTEENAYYVYVNESGTVAYAIAEPSRTANIVLGIFYWDGSMVTALDDSGDLAVNGALTRTNDFMRRLGIFIYDNGGKLLVMQGTGNELKVLSGGMTIQRGLASLTLGEVDMSELGTRMFTYYLAADVGWERWYGMETYSGIIPVAQYNNIANNSQGTISANLTFTNGSAAVSCATDITSEVSVGDYVHLTADGPVYHCRVAAIAYTTQTDITLSYNYEGTGGTGPAIVDKAIQDVPSGKFVKHLFFRTAGSDYAYIALGQAYYDTVEEAIAAGRPQIPDALVVHAINIAYIICSPGDTTLSNIIDIRPLPFTHREGGGQSVGTAMMHDEMTDRGLDSNHLQYTLVSGTRPFSGVQSYNYAPTFTADNQIVTKKFVTDNLHARQHAINSTSDHVGNTGAATGNIPLFNANGIPYTDSGFKPSDFATQGEAYSAYSISDAVASGNHTVYADKQVWQVTPPLTGYYEVHWGAEISVDKASIDIKLLVDIDNTTVVNECAFSCNSANIWNGQSNFGVFALTGETQYTFKIKYASGASNTVASIRRCRMTLKYLNI